MQQAQPPRHRRFDVPEWVPSTTGGLFATVLGAAVLPGSVYLREGRRRLGWAVLAPWLILVVGLLGGLAFLLVTRDVHALTSLAVSPQALRIAWIAAGVVGVVWLVLLLDQVRRLHPLRLPAFHQRAGVVLLVAALIAGGLGPLTLTARTAQTQRDLLRTVFREAPEVDSFSARERAQRPDGRLNILLLGGDSGPGRIGTRADSILVASVDRRSGKSVLISLPRNFQHAPFPAGSEMAARFPNGFDDLLNAVYSYGEANPHLFPGARNTGAEALTQAVNAITGLSIDYYVFVNLAGFEDVVDAVGGITLRVEDRVPIGGATGENGQVLEYPKDWIEPGLHHLDGYHALWYARGRFGSDDYQRMRRQRCVIGALLDQADPQQVLLNYPRLAASAKHLVDTNIPQSALPELADIALDARNESVRTVTLTRSVINTVNPNIDEIHRLVSREIRRSVASPMPEPGTVAAAPPGTTPSPSASSTPSPTSAGAPSATPTTTPTATASGTPTSEDVADDLSSVCRYS